LAYKYAALGAKVALTARRGPELEKVAAKCRELGALQATIFASDVSTEAGWNAITSHIDTEYYGALDLLVLNAGISMGSYFSDLVREGDAMRLTKKLLDVNVVGKSCIFFAQSSLARSVGLVLVICFP
jgi:NAD(P)-dependent dehydrogenase (short-subunit alcohol dehydrogenase family)